jgi:hypothetical protein
LLFSGLLLAGCTAVPYFGEDTEVHANFIGGYRAVNHDVFEDHPVVGLELQSDHAGDPFGYEVGYLVGWEDQDVGNVEHEATFHEAYAGLRRTWHPRGNMRPYVGGGAAWMKAEREATSGGVENDFEDNGAGGYVHAGIAWRLGYLPLDRWTEVLLGIDVRGVVGDDMDYGQVALTLGFGR